MGSRHNALLRPTTRRLTLAKNAQGHIEWAVSEQVREFPAARTAVILCDVWDSHWCRGAVERLEAMLPRMNAVAGYLRTCGAQIIHCPSGTMAAYEQDPARRRVVEAPSSAPPQDIRHEDPPMPIDDSEGGCDTDANNGDPNTPVWSCQHPAIVIDQDVDVISDSGPQIFSFLRFKQIAHVLIMGVHTNMCILKRSFGIKQMVQWGVDIMLFRDLTDSMYNPAKPPYVSHAAGTSLVIEYIEKFWCPSFSSADILP